MTDSSDGGSARTGAAIAYVCANLADLRALLDNAGPLDDVLTAVRGAADVTPALEHLHAALRATGDALGVFGHAGRSVGTRPAGVPRSGPTETLFLCPRHRCSRHSWPSGDAPPECAIDNLAMARTRLR